MASRSLSYLFKETRLNLEPTSQSSVVQVRLPSTPAASRTSFPLSRRSTSTPTSEEDEAFRSTNLASAASIYHRQHHDSPRAFLWRVLQDGMVLSLRSADVSRQERLADAPLTLHLQFPSRIRPNCVALADPKNHDGLAVFVLDEDNYLFSLMLRPDCFRRRAVTEGGLGSDACKFHLSSSFSFKHPFRLVAHTDEVVVAALHDGGILKFERAKAHEGSGHLWKESHFNASSWLHGVRSMLPFGAGQTVRHGKVNMEMAAAASMLTSSFELPNSSFLLSVCLDHRLRIWNLDNGAVLDSRDILNVDRDPKGGEIGKWTIDPSQSSLVRIISEGEGNSVCLTYSPIGAGEFKFWRIRAQDSNTIKVQDMYPETHLQPPPPSSDIWTLADFAINSVSGQGYYIWTLWKNNMSYRVQRIHVHQGTISRLDSDDVVDVYTDSQFDPPETANYCDPSDSTEKWLDSLLYPGRFTKATLETALNIYERGLGTKKDASAVGSKGVAEKICFAVSQTVSLDRSLEGGMDYERFRRASETQWRRFYRLVLELDKQRGEALSLVHDPRCNLHSGLVWVVCTDIASVVRECNDIGRLYHGLPSTPRDMPDVATLMTAGITFVDSFSDSMVQICNSVLRSEVFQDSTQTDMERLQFFSDKAGFWRQISDEDCTQVTSLLGENFNKVTPQVYERLHYMASSSDDERARARSSLNPLTEFGRKIVIKATQDEADTWRRIFFSQLILLVHMEFEFDSDEDILHKRIDIGATYRFLIAILKRLELVQWLAKTQISVPGSRLERNREGSISGSSPILPRKNGSDELQVITALEGSVGHLLGIPDTNRNTPFASSITDVVADLLAFDSDIELAPGLIQCSLLKRDRADLALEMSPFADQAPFATYVQGRVALALKDFETAASYFSKAAVGMSSPRQSFDRHSSGLLDDSEWKLLNSGLSQYYSHIASLFDVSKAHSHVLSFATLSLQFPLPNPRDRTELLSRIFSSATSISHFETAHNALVQMSLSPTVDRAVLQSSLRRLVGTMCEHCATDELVSLPFVDLADAVDSELDCRAKSVSGAQGGTPYHDVLYAWRVRRGDYRGAAAVLYDRIAKLRKSGDGDLIPTSSLAGGEFGTGSGGGDVGDLLETPLTRLYLMLINTLSCIGGGGEKEGWIMAEEEEEVDDEDHRHAGTMRDDSQMSGMTSAVATATKGVKFAATPDSMAKQSSATKPGAAFKNGKITKTTRTGTKRRVLTLADIRRQYQEELDRIAAIQNNQFGFESSPTTADVRVTPAAAAGTPTRAMAAGADGDGDVSMS